MKRSLLRSSAFIRAAKQFLKKHPSLANDLQTSLMLLEADAFHPKLKTHKLKGNLIGLWACSGGYDLRIIFEFVQFESSEAILLQTLGSHDEVY
jgi:mRNA-degrading endonuclease YafQ of YafQ-DinJ toxin-antitoxin module